VDLRTEKTPVGAGGRLLKGIKKSRRCRALLWVGELMDGKRD
jgi:hypothetical protein